MSQGGVMLLMLSSLFQLGITDQCQIHFWHVNNAAQVQRGQGYLEAYVSRLSQSKADVSQDASVGGLLPSRVDSGHVSCCITQVQRLEGGGTVQQRQHQHGPKNRHSTACTVDHHIRGLHGIGHPDTKATLQVLHFPKPTNRTVG